MRKRDRAIALGLALCATLLAACGGGAGGTESGGGGQAAKEEAPLEFAACMRAHGVAIEDPQPGESIALPDHGPKTKKAAAACDGKLAAGQELSDEEDEELEEGALAFSRCMREEGIEMGDPTFLGRGKFLLDIAGLDTTSPAFEAAREACQGKMPELDIAGVGG
jgi:hypothetical protein